MQNLKSFNERLTILSASERKLIYDLPNFTKQERELYFQLEKIEEDIVFNQLHGLNSRIYFVLQLAYFKASYRFFKFNLSEVAQDVEHILQRYFPENSSSSVRDSCDRKTTLNHQSIILKLFSYRLATKEDAKAILNRAKSIVLIDANPKYIFKEIVRFASSNKIILPAYSSMQKLVSKAITLSEKELFHELELLIDSELAANIDNLLVKESQFRYQLTLIKAPPQNFSHKQAVNECRKLEQIQPIFNRAKVIFRKLRISNLSIKYFADLVDRYTIQNLCRFEKVKKSFYILCFIHYRYIKTNDDLTKTFLYFAQKYKNEVKGAVEEKVLEMRIENSCNFRKGAGILRLLTDRSISDELTVGDLRAKAFTFLPANKITKLANFLEKSDIDFEQLRWQEYDQKFYKIRSNLRHIFKSLNFTTNAKRSSAHVFEAVQFLQNHLDHNQRKIKNPPTNFIPKNLHKYLYQKVDGKAMLMENRYEILIYRMLKNKIDSSDIFIPDSADYCSLESDLVDAEYFKAHSDKICNDLGNDFLTGNFEERIGSKLDEVDRLFEEVNGNILKGENTSFRFKDGANKEGKWHLDYEGIEDKDVNNPIFNKIPKIDLADLVFFINKKTKFSSAFTHILNQNLKSDASDTDLLGAIIAYATNIGLGKMASCSNLSYHQLRKIKDNYLREDTLNMACDIIVNEINKLPIQKIYEIDGAVHSSIDGKKYTTSDNIFNARYSQKYFGYGKGISVLTLIANFLPLGSKIISPNEYEGNFGLEMLLMNESDVKPQINSTDMHGIKELNHALYDFAGYDFQPRYTNIAKQADKLHCSKNPKEYSKNYVIKPSNQVDIKLILEEDFNIKRIVASMMLKTCTISNIVRKLSSSMKSNKTRKAIAEYNKILRTIHILKSINSLKYRQNIQIALNRGESYHQLAGNVSYANNGKIMAKTEQEQLLFKECTRLVCNIIIYYNSYILSQFYLEKQKLGQVRQIEALRRISPISWTSINLYGKYEFSKITTPTSFSKLSELVKNDVLVKEEEIENL
jgi:TnpA family transposase